MRGLPGYLCDLKYVHITGTLPSSGHIGVGPPFFSAFCEHLFVFLYMSLNRSFKNAYVYPVHTWKLLTSPLDSQHLINQSINVDNISFDCFRTSTCIGTKFQGIIWQLWTKDILQTHFVCSVNYIQPIILTTLHSPSLMWPGGAAQCVMHLQSCH